MKVRLAFIGAGFMGQLAHIRSYALLHDECELVALAEPRPQTAKLVAQRYGIGRVFRDHRELLDSVEVDGIVAAQPYRYHAELLPELYPRTRYLFTEKPLALGAATGERLSWLAREHGCLHMLGYHRRSDPATRSAKQWAGELGALRYLRVCFTDGDWIANSSAGLIDTGEEPSAFDAEEPPAQFAGDADACWALEDSTDKIVHPLNLLRHFLGEPYRLVYVYSSGRLLAFESESGVPAVIEVTPYRLSVGFDEELLVACERGAVRLRPAANLSVNRSGTVEIYRDVTRETIVPQLPWIDPMQSQAADFLRVCRGEIPPPTAVDEAAVDLQLVAEIVAARIAAPGGREGIDAERNERYQSSRAVRATSDAPLAGSKK